jgi:hypothetical protein
MVPDIDLQLQVVIKALESSILPALDAANPQAAEQCQLALATLAFVRQRLPLHRRLVRKELADNLALAQSLCGAHDFTASTDCARSALEDAELDSAELAEVNATLLAELSAAVEASAGDREVAQRVIAAYKDRGERARAWFLPAGFELDEASIPTLNSLLKRS